MKPHWFPIPSPVSEIAYKTPPGRVEPYGSAWLLAKDNAWLMH